MERKHTKWLKSQIHNIQNKEVHVNEDSYKLSSEGTYDTKTHNKLITTCFHHQDQLTLIFDPNNYYGYY